MINLKLIGKESGLQREGYFVEISRIIIVLLIHKYLGIIKL